MAGLKRHIGRLKNTDRRIVVIYMQIPQSLDKALICDTDALPDQFHEFLMNVVESESAQTTVNLADVLDRRASPDAGLNLMNSLHRRGFMRPEPIENIIMFPRPNMPFPLSKVIELTRKEAETPNIPRSEDPDPGKYNQFTENMNIETKQQTIDVAKSILYDAQLLQDEVLRKRNQAYQMAPSLRPGSDQYIPDKAVVQEPATQTFLPKTPDVSPEYLEIMAKAQEHLDRAIYREEHSDTTIGEETKIAIAVIPKKTTARPKKKQTA